MSAATGATNGNVNRISQVKMSTKLFSLPLEPSINFHPNLCYYRPQRSWDKVIFSEVCVKNSVHRGGAGCLGRHPPRSRHPHRSRPPGKQTPPGAVHAARYGQQAGGTHPTGMHTCFHLQS